MNDQFEAIVESTVPSGSLAWLRIGRARVASRLWPDIQVGQKAVVRISPQDVVLCLSHPGPTSARNVLPGHVASLRHVPDGVHVTLDVGFPLVSLVTRRAVDELSLRRGTAVIALIKATAIRLHLEFAAKVQIALRGAKGLIDLGGIEFLRAIARGGSLSEAARASRVTYRTAWARAQALNRAWGRPLIAQMKGGQGGGGTVLTSEGEAAVHFADDVLQWIEEKLPTARRRRPGSARIAR